MKIFKKINEKENDYIHIHWDITTKCNFDCSYCYAKYEYSKKNQWQKEEQEKNIKLILKSIELANLPVTLEIVGGEPTISKNYFLIVEQLQKKFLKSNKNKLYITTNLSKNLNWWKKHPNLKNTTIVASFHPEFINDIEEFLEKINYLKNFFNIRINVMLLDNYEKKLKNFFYKLSILNLDKKIKILPHIIYYENSPFKDINNQYKNLEKFKYWFQDEKEFIFENKRKEYLTLYEVYVKKINNFKKWKCWQNNYEINLNGDVINICSRKKDNLIQNPLFFFKKINQIHPIICPHEFCNCYDLLKCKKIKI